MFVLKKRGLPRFQNIAQRNLFWKNSAAISTQTHNPGPSRSNVHLQLKQHFIPKSFAQNLFQSTTQVLGMSIGASSAIIMYYLAASFGEKIASPFLGLENEPATTKTLAIFLGTCAYTSMAALSVSAMNDIVKSGWQRGRADVTQITVLLGYGTLGALSAIPQSSLTLKEFLYSPSAIAWGLTASAFLGPLAFNSIGLIGLIAILKSHYNVRHKPDESHTKWINYLKVRIYHMSPQEGLSLGKNILFSKDTTAEERLQNFEDFCQETIKQYLDLPIKSHSFHSQSTIGLIGTIPLGFLAGVPYIKLGTEGAKLYAHQFDFMMSHVALHAVGMGGYIANSALASFAMQKRLEQALSSNCKRKWVTMITAPLGFIAATPLIYISIIDLQNNTFWHWLVVGSVTIGTTMVRWGSLENLVNRIIDAVSNYSII
ncbi:MAG: hypothetical protein H0U75_06595 [Legionella sp.]|nr:hypothetical protein [Legionella sp.]